METFAPAGDNVGIVNDRDVPLGILPPWHAADWLAGGTGRATVDRHRMLEAGGVAGFIGARRSSSALVTTNSQPHIATA